MKCPFDKKDCDRNGKCMIDVSTSDSDKYEVILEPCKRHPYL